MRNFLLTAAAGVALLAGVSIASAAQVTGTISAVDQANSTVTLDSGQSFVLANTKDSKASETQTAATQSFKAGDRVTITYDELNGKLTATQITPAM